ncbi:MAG: hypothetical protein IT249_15635 [Chitinophagaceae bacterium]|nr:hypothetical protein [Chitinophagaceae bacterium]
MKTSHLLFTLAAFIVLGSIASCKKEDKKSKTELITSGSWKIQSVYVSQGSTKTDLYTSAEACEKDNFYTFHADGSVIYDEGASKCDEEDDQTQSGQWSFIENETKLILEGDTTNVASLTGSELKLTYSYTLSGNTVNYETTFIHK